MSVPHAESGDVRLEPLVVAVDELVYLGATSGAAGVVALGLSLALGSLSKFTPMEYVSGAVIPVVTIGSTYATALLGKRTGPAMLYRRVLDRAPSPPRALRQESLRPTAIRAVVIAIALGAVLLMVAALTEAFSLAFMGRKRDDIPDHLTELAGIIGGAWMLGVAVAALQIRRYLQRWEASRGHTILCRPLNSGLMSPVYYVEGGPVAFKPPPAAPSPRAVAGSDLPPP